MSRNRLLTYLNESVLRNSDTQIEHAGEMLEQGVLRAASPLRDLCCSRNVRTFSQKLKERRHKALPGWDAARLVFIGATQVPVRGHPFLQVATFPLKVQMLLHC